MNQTPFYPMPTTYSQPVYQPPQLNAVKIDIINPQAIGGQQQAPVMQEQPQYFYSYPTAQTYNIPTTSYYGPQAQAMPQAQYPVMPPMPPVPQYPQQVPVMDQTITQNVQTVPPTPVPPPPSVIDEQPAPQQVAQPQVVQEPQAANVPTAGIDVAAINAALKSDDLDAQTNAIQQIAEIGQSNPQQAAALLNEETFTGLTNIITRDTTALPGPTQKQIELRQKLEAGKNLTPQEQQEAETLSPQEKAEINKQFGTYTLAVLQKNFREAIDAEAAKQGVQSVTINELPGITEVVNNLKDNPNPIIREASIQALKYIAKPEDKEVLKTIFDISAKQDADPSVRQSAQEALNALPA